MDESIEIEVKAKGIPELRSELKQLKSDLANATDPADIERLSMAAGDLADKITDINEKVAIFSAGSDFEKVNNGLALVSDQLSNMDFEGASESARLLTANIKNMNPKDIADGFKAFAGTIGQLSKAFVQMGLKLLANPLFLLVAIIGGIVVAIVMLKDKIGILQKAFDLMMAPINLVIQGLKNLGDWLGLTAFAAEESADRQVAANKRVAESSKEVTDSKIAQLDREIKLSKAAGKDVTELEIKKQEVLKKGSEDLLKLARSTYAELDAIRKNGKSKLTEDQMKEFEEAAKTIKTEKENIKNFETDKNVIILTKNKEAQDNADKAAKEASDKRKAQYERERQELQRQKDALKSIEQRFQNDINNLNAVTEEQRLKLQRDKDQEELNNIKLSTEAKKNAQLLLNQKYAKLEEQLEKDKQQRILDITTDYTNRLKDLEAITAIEKLNRQLEVDAEEEAKAIEKLEKEGATAEQIQAVRNYYDTLEKDRRRIYNEELVAEENTLKEQRIAIEQAYQDAKRNALETGLGILQGFAGQNKAVALGILAIQKGLAIADVVVGAAKSIALAKANLAAVPAVIGVAPNPMYAVQAAATLKGIATTKITAATSIASILASGIQSAKSISGGGGSTGGGTIGGGGATSQPAQPSFQLFGGRNQGNEATSSQTVESRQQNQTITVNAIVSETEMTNTQNRVRTIQQNSEL